MARLFENADFGDLGELIERNHQLQLQRQQLAEQAAQLDEQAEQLARSIQAFIEVMQESGISKSQVQELLISRHKLSEEKAKQNIQSYWIV